MQFKEFYIIFPRLKRNKDVKCIAVVISFLRIFIIYLIVYICYPYSPSSFFEPISFREKFLYANPPDFDLWDSFFMLNKLTKTLLEKSKILQIFEKISESRLLQTKNWALLRMLNPSTTGSVLVIPDLITIDTMFINPYPIGGKIKLPLCLKVTVLMV